MASLQGFSGLKALYDIENYPNYISINFLDLATDEIIRFRIDPDNGIDERDACETYFRGLSAGLYRITRHGRVRLRRDPTTREEF